MAKNSTNPTMDESFSDFFMGKTLHNFGGVNVAEFTPAVICIMGLGCKVIFVVRLLKDQGRAFVPSVCFD
jgi:hypothetical protein